MMALFHRWRIGIFPILIGSSETARPARQSVLQRAQHESKGKNRYAASGIDDWY